MLFNDNSVGAQFAHYFRTAKSLLFGDEDRPGRWSLSCARCSDQLSLATLHLFARDPETGLWEVPGPVPGMSPDKIGFVEI